MIYTELTRKALMVAYKAHKNQLDKAGKPYIFHSYHLAEQMNDEYTCCTALLHDTVEDANVTIEAIRKMFPREVADAVELLTHDKHVPYMSYVKNLKSNPIAKKVKLADLKHNMDVSRFRGVSLTSQEKEAIRHRIATKYQPASDYLSR
ncbi:HD domain-containing protein [Absicoccus porci]|uniref:HD domain-containing protein n=1 Tax=Absicoccus porci TaxID=2486576 RepID=UPI00294287DA|nr:HD domain-containing protein [Absicoccus porci]